MTTQPDGGPMDTQPPLTDAADAPGVREMISRLVDDTAGYARAEMNYLKAELGDRSSHIGPALGLFGAAIALALALLVALIVGLTIWLGEAIGLGWSILIVTFLGAIGVWLLAIIGSAHIKRAFRPWEKP